jgi:hemerythrin-like domain-containing protein
MNSIELMMDEHKYIKRGLAIIRKISIAILNGTEVPYDDFKKLIDFIRNYADKHHHNKEEEILFKKMTDELGAEMVQAPISGMLVEHDFGRLFVKNLELALERVKEGDNDSKVDIIANAIGYTDLLNRHIDKEDKVIYTFARRSLSEDALRDVDERCEEVESMAKSKNVQKGYKDTIEALEKKWM